jgi:8-amino-7-oxononanoate synthase
VNRGALRHLTEELADLERRGLLRERPAAIDQIGKGPRLHLCSNDYLGYRTTGRLFAATREAAVRHAAGAGASRLVAGEHVAHGALERALADWLEYPNTLVFTSGYAANTGTIAALVESDDLVVSDQLNHASIIDGCRVSRARCEVVPHNSLEAIRAALRGGRARHRWVVTESYFSMDGDGPDLGALRAICDEYDAARVVDEAHAIGVLGPGGRGRLHAAGVHADVLIGTLGKALGTQGAFVAGSGELCAWLWNRARSFVFSTGLSPLLAAIGRAAVEEARRDDAGRTRLAEVGTRLRAGLAEFGVRVANGDGPILPVILGAESEAVAWSRLLLEQGVLVQAIRPPTVAPGLSRLRVTARPDLSDADVDAAVKAFGVVARARGSGA